MIYPLFLLPEKEWKENSKRQRKAVESYDIVILTKVKMRMSLTDLDPRGFFDVRKQEAAMTEYKSFIKGPEEVRAADADIS